jgi:hypothetical protein
MLSLRFRFVALVLSVWPLAARSAVEPWRVGVPIVTYWAGPGYPGGSDLTDAAAQQLAEGGWNVVWCDEAELDVAQRHGLRGMLTVPGLSTSWLDDPVKQAALEALIGRVKKHPAFYAWHLFDEPPATRFPRLARLTEHLREQDPAHLSYINLLPTYANNEQLGVPGAKVAAYMEHLRQFVDIVRPALLSYDHYHFTHAGDTPDYFLNLALVRNRATAAHLPMMNIVQAATWGPTSLASPHRPRVPTPEEMRFLVYTTLAYGAQGISYYVYCFPEHGGGIALPDGTPTPLYHALKPLNHEFVAIASQLQPLLCRGVCHAGMMPPGAVPLPEHTSFTFDPAIPPVPYTPNTRVEGLLLSRFGTAEASSHAMVVNLDYTTARTIGLTGPAPLEVFDATTRRWAPAAPGGSRVELTLPGGGGKLVRVRQVP